MLETSVQISGFAFLRKSQ